jgi:hypothetical protein
MQKRDKSQQRPKMVEKAGGEIIVQQNESQRWMWVP